MHIANCFKILKGSRGREGCTGHGTGILGVGVQGGHFILLSIWVYLKFSLINICESYYVYILHIHSTDAHNTCAHTHTRTHSRCSPYAMLLADNCS